MSSKFPPASNGSTYSTSAIFEKVNILLNDGDGSDENKDERFLVALILYTSLPNKDVCGKSYDDNKTVDVLLAFSQRLLLVPDLSTSPPTISHDVMVRWTIRLVSHVMVTVATTNFSNSILALWKSLLNIFERRNKRFLTFWETIDLDLIVFFQECLDAASYDETTATSTHTCTITLTDLRIRTISLVWERFQCVTNNNGNATTNTSKSDQNDEKYLSRDWSIMIDTLQALLPSPNSEGALKEQTDQAVLEIMQRHASTIAGMCQQVPSWYQSLLSWAPRQQSLQWQQVILMVSCSPSLALLFNKERWLEAHPDEAQSICKIVLAHVSSNDGTRTSLSGSDNVEQAVGVAWNVVAVLVESCGWEWTLSKHSTPNITLGTAPPTSNFGRASDMCVILRMASGEFRIRLGLNLERKQQQKEPPEKGNTDEDTSLWLQDGVLEACGRVILSGLNFMVQLAEGLGDETTLPLSTEALLHVRHSLRDTLDASMEYFLIEQTTATTKEKVPSLFTSDGKLSLDMLISRMFGSLMRELVSDLEADALSSALQAIHAVLSNILPNIQRKDEAASLQILTTILPCLAHIFSTTDKNTLQQHNLLSAIVVVGPISSHFSQLMKLSSVSSSSLQAAEQEQVASFVSWSCHVVEAWCDLANPPMNQRRQMTRSLLELIRHWVQGVTDPGRSSSTPLSYLEPTIVLGCYIMLLGESTPTNEEERQLIEQAVVLMQKENI